MSDKREQVDAMLARERELENRLATIRSKRYALESEISREACPFKSGQLIEWFSPPGCRRIGEVVDGATIGNDPILKVKDRDGIEEIIWETHKPRKLKKGEA